MTKHTFLPGDPRVEAVAEALSRSLTSYAVMRTGPDPEVLAIDAMNALRDHYIANHPVCWVLVMRDPGDKKIQCIKEVRGATNLGLKDAKDFIEGRMPATLPVTFDKKGDAQYTKAFFDSIGAVVEIEERYGQ